MPPKPFYLLFLCTILHFRCAGGLADEKAAAPLYDHAGAIVPPAGFNRLPAGDSSFAGWLRNVSFKKDNTVYLYNGQPKPYQRAQYAVLNIPVGKKDLQQCADAVIRLRAEYLYSQQRWNEIAFLSTSGQSISFTRWLQGERYRLAGNRLQGYDSGKKGGDRRMQFEAYLEFVFMYAGTYSLQQQLRKVFRFTEIMPGDVLVKGGAPGHAMIVMDVVADKQGNRKYLLAQSYMPAQDIHIVRNPENEAEDPWYDAGAAGSIRTPEWVFARGQLYRW